MQSLQVGSLNVVLHRTVRVAEGRQPAQLPPSLGRMDLYAVKEYRDKCPESWEDEAVFAVLHPQEAMWMSFTPHDGPVAVICGAGGINALTGKPLALTLETGNYMVCPTQPWLDGWKDQDGSVYQFCATAYKGGEGATVAEQLLGKESKSGGIGLAVFEPKDRTTIKTGSAVPGGWMSSAYDDPQQYSFACKEATLCCTSGGATRSASFSEMGLGKGGKIVQKVYADENTVDAWKAAPAAVKVIYLVSAETFAEITGLQAPPSPVTAEKYAGKWYGLQDGAMPDVAGSSAFTGLKTVFQAADLPPEGN